LKIQQRGLEINEVESEMEARRERQKDIIKIERQNNGKAQRQRTENIKMERQKTKDRKMEMQKRGMKR
jgi:hypothetical protein